jgi:hypothetical protein
VWAPEEVRQACAFVAERAELVQIDHERLATFARSLDGVAPEEERSGVEYAVTFNAVNFGSGWHPFLDKEDGASGSVTMMTRLRHRFEADGPLSAEELERLTAESCAELFGQQLRPPVDELMALFARSLNDLGSFLLARFDGSFEGLVGAAGASATRLVELLQEMPMYRDVASYGGTPVPFLKRAQLTASELGGFRDLDRLTVFADNLVPHVLRVEGVLRLDDQLERAIDTGELLEPGGAAEVELRATAVHAGELIAKGSGLTPRQIDLTLWRRGQEPRFKARHRPRIRTYFY